MRPTTVFEVRNRRGVAGSTIGINQESQVVPRGCVQFQFWHWPTDSHTFTPFVLEQFPPLWDHPWSFDRVPASSWSHAKVGGNQESSLVKPSFATECSRSTSEKKPWSRQGDSTVRIPGGTKKDCSRKLPSYMKLKILSVSTTITKAPVSKAAVSINREKRLGRR